MRNYQHTAITELDMYDILYGRQKSDDGVGVNFYIDLYFASPQRCETCT